VANDDDGQADQLSKQIQKNDTQQPFFDATV